MAKQSTKDILLNAGIDLFLSRGYSNTGIEAIVQSAKVPKGSFYHYFESKEVFGLAVLDRFAERANEELDQILTDPSRNPMARIRRLVELRCERLESQQCRNGCLIGNLSLEMADQSEEFRARIDSIFKGWVGRYAACLQRAQEFGEIAEHVDPRELAEFWMNSWQGAVLRAKTIRSVVPLRIFENVMFRLVVEAGEFSRALNA